MKIILLIFTYINPNSACVRLYQNNLFVMILSFLNASTESLLSFPLKDIKYGELHRKIPCNLATDIDV